MHSSNGPLNSSLVNYSKMGRDKQRNQWRSLLGQCSIANHGESKLAFEDVGGVLYILTSTLILSCSVILRKLRQEKSLYKVLWRFF